MRKWIRDALPPALWARLKFSFFNSKGESDRAFGYYGTKVYFPKGSLIFQMACDAKRFYEEENQVLLTTLFRKGTWFIDVGANIGLMGIPMLNRFDDLRLLSFEPSPNNLPYLERTRDESRFRGRWEVVGKAAGATRGTVEMQIAAQEYGALDSLGDPHRFGTRRGVVVEMTTLDLEWRERGEPEVSLIKIDVEGFEDEVVRGAEALLRRCRPAVLVEISRITLQGLQRDSEMWDITRSLDYSIFRCDCMVRVENPGDLKRHMLNTEDFLLLPDEWI